MPEALDLAKVLRIGRSASRTLRSSSGDSRWADDVEQEAMLGAYRAWCRGTTDPGFIFKAARTQAIDFLRQVTKHRSKRQIEMVALSVVDEATTPDGTHFEEFVCDRFSPEFAFDLTDREQQIVSLLALGHYQRNVADLLGVSESRICQILTKLRARYPDYALGRRQR